MHLALMVSTELLAGYPSSSLGASRQGLWPHSMHPERESVEIRGEKIGGQGGIETSCRKREWVCA